MTKSQKSKLPIRKYLILIFIAVLLISNSTFSKYVSTSTGNAETRVAIFESNVTVNLYVGKMMPGETVDVPIIVSNFEDLGDTIRVSEVSQRYTLEEEIEGNIPLTLEWDINNGDFFLANNPKDSGQSHPHTLTVHWPETENDYTLQDELVVIRITVNVEQID